MIRTLLFLAMAAALAACAGAPTKSASQPSPLRDHGRVARSNLADTPGRRSPYAPAQEDVSKRGNYTRGGLYAPGIADSAPDNPLHDVDQIPEPVVKDEPKSIYGNRSPYNVLGKNYRVLDSAKGYDERGIASYYGTKFHGRRTSNLEVYDMYAFTAAHKTLPLPSYARVTNLDNGKSVIVRINDRGPFHDGRIIDLSYAAAVKLGVNLAGTAPVEVQGLSAGENARNTYDAIAQQQAAPPAPAPVRTTLPPGVRIATGEPAPMPTTRVASVGTTAMDKLMNALPIASAQAAERTPGAATVPSRAVATTVVPGATTPASAIAPVAASAATEPAAANSAAANREWRFDMLQNGKAMTADEFDAWMKSRRAHVATGKPGTPDPALASPATRALAASTASVPGTPAAATSASAQASMSRTGVAFATSSPSTPTQMTSAPTALATSRIAAAAPPPPAPAVAAATVAASTPASSDAVTLQVASFANAQNADHALALLRGASIDEARLLDANVNGQKIWRLRIGPIAATRAPGLAARIVGLGFGQPQRVRE